MEKDKLRKKAEMVPGALDMLILKTLERNREPMHGYGIALVSTANYKRMRSRLRKGRSIPRSSAWPSRAG
jgi:hypothetical protein